MLNNKFMSQQLVQTTDIFVQDNGRDADTEYRYDAMPGHPSGTCTGVDCPDCHTALFAGHVMYGGNAYFVKRQCTDLPCGTIASVSDVCVTILVRHNFIFTPNADMDTSDLVRFTSNLLGVDGHVVRVKDLFVAHHADSIDKMNDVVPGLGSARVVRAEIIQTHTDLPIAVGVSLLEGQTPLFDNKVGTGGDEYDFIIEACNSTCKSNTSSGDTLVPYRCGLHTSVIKSYLTSNVDRERDACVIVGDNIIRVPVDTSIGILIGTNAAAFTSDDEHLPVIECIDEGIYGGLIRNYYEVNSVEVDRVIASIRTAQEKMRIADTKKIDVGMSVLSEGNMYTAMQNISKVVPVKRAMAQETYNVGFTLRMTVTYPRADNILFPEGTPTQKKT